MALPAVARDTGSWQAVSQSEGSEPESPEGTQCGLGGWRPEWLQRLASKKTYGLMYGLVGLQSGITTSYFIATLSTLEKRFKIPSKTSGALSAALDVGSCFSLLAFGYLGTGHKTRYFALGIFGMAAACVIAALPHAIYGPGQDALRLTREHGAAAAAAAARAANASSAPGPSYRGPLCGAGERAAEGEEEEDCTDGGSFSAPTVIMFVSQFVFGLGECAYFSLGAAYLDDNTPKEKAPLALGATQVIRMLGPTIGYAFAAYALSQYVDPSLHPVINTKDPRWIGAWWMGWAPMAATTAVLGFLMLLFPKQLPRAAERRRARRLPPPPDTRHSLADFWAASKRLFRNKVMLYNTLSGVLFTFGFIGYGTFMPKYLETQYGKSAAEASAISGAVRLLFTGLGIAASAAVITYFKLGARTLAGWSVLVEIVDVLVHCSWAFLSCGEQDLHGGWSADGGPWNLTSACNAGCGCGPEVKYAPVCWLNGSTTFYSACHAGCSDSSLIDNSTLLANCACAGGEPVLGGSCPRECGFNFTLFIVTQCITRFLTASGVSANVLIQFRCVAEADKSLALAMAQFLSSILAFVPGPSIYGWLLDSACLLWGRVCGEPGHCWLYDGLALRRRINFTAAVFLFLGLIMDVMVWYHCKGVQMYDTDDPGGKADNYRLKDKTPADEVSETSFMDRAS